MKKGYGGDTRIKLEGTQKHSWYVDSYMGGSRYLCKCVCGTTRLVTAQSLMRDDSKSCGCMRPSSLGQTPREYRKKYARTEKFE